MSINSTRTHSPKLGVGSVSALEIDVLNVIWERFEAHNHGVTVPEVFDALYPSRRLAYTTIMTVMSRLAKKGVLNQNQLATPYVYAPMLSRDALKATLILEIDKRF